MSDITANLVVGMPAQLFTLARSFKANANGKVYLGVPDTDPTIPTNQIPVYIESETGDLIPAAQPIVINSGGYPVYNGQISKFVTVQNYSMAVYDAYGSQQFYFPDIAKYDPDQFGPDLLKQLSQTGPYANDNTKGDAMIGVLQPFTGAIHRTQHQKNADVVSLKDFAIGDGVSDEYTAIMAAYNWAASHGKSLFIPSGVYKFSQKLVFDIPEVSIFGAGIKSSSLQFTGSGIAVEFNDSNPNHNEFAFTGGVFDVEIVGNPNSTILLYNKNVNHWHAARINLRESSPTSGVGLKIVGPTGCHLSHIVCSTNAQHMDSRPFAGIWLDADPVTGSRTSCTTNIHPIIEGMSGDGIVMKGCDQTTTIGGTSENNDGNGVTLSDSGQPRINKFIGVGFENNRGFADVFDAGQMNFFENCYTSKLAYFGPTSLFSELKGGYHQKITTEGDFTSIHDLKFSFFANGGTIESKESSKVYNVYNSQTSALASFPKAGHQITLGTSPFLFTNNYGFPIDVMLSVDSVSTVTATWFCEGTTRNLKVDATGGIRLDPGNSLDIVYTGTPTFYWMPR
ncbi:phage head-binding domain-containing protein [Citrobacter cronae]|uniref:phage head-binding domain-containing protein n=1 Tax=Citrobacter cronae TaxID=1748967 RepID=UPI002DB9D2CE|nr:phage head-binding domain-containing protein [Citrobacter cronae]MEB5757185.1 phage head-binding domain-containing protein [Citrobacter cronae]